MRRGARLLPCLFCSVLRQLRRSPDVTFTAAGGTPAAGGNSDTDDLSRGKGVSATGIVSSNMDGHNDPFLLEVERSFIGPRRPRWRWSLVGSYLPGHEGGIAPLAGPASVGMST